MGEREVRYRFWIDFQMGHFLGGMKQFLRGRKGLGLRQVPCMRQRRKAVSKLRLRICSCQGPQRWSPCQLK
jgi:hypothetical protein